VLLLDLLDRRAECGCPGAGLTRVFDGSAGRGQTWLSKSAGQWPGEDDCTRLGFYVNGDPDFPDLNRLLTDCVWDADAQRWERKQ
jgi:hypothetical protein